MRTHKTISFRIVCLAAAFGAPLGTVQATAVLLSDGMAVAARGGPVLFDNSSSEPAPTLEESTLLLAAGPAPVPPPVPRVVATGQPARGGGQQQGHQWNRQNGTTSSHVSDASHGARVTKESGKAPTPAVGRAPATPIGTTSAVRFFGPNLFASDPQNGTGEWEGEFWPGAGRRASASAGVPGDTFQIMWGDWVFRTGDGPITYPWGGRTYYNPGHRTLPLVESVDRPYLEYMINTYCKNGDWVVLDEEYIEPWYARQGSQEQIDKYKAKMTLLSWAKSYGHPRRMNFSHFRSGPLPVSAWSGFYRVKFTDPGPGWRTDMDRFYDKGIEKSQWNYRQWCAAQDFYAPDLYMHDNSVEWWKMRLTACKWFLSKLPPKPVIPMVSPQCWSPCPLPPAYPPAPPLGTPVALDVLGVMADDLSATFNKTYWYIGAHFYSWGDPRNGTGWFQLHPGTLPPQIQLITDKIRAPNRK